MRGGGPTPVRPPVQRGLGQLGGALGEAAGLTVLGRPLVLGMALGFGWQMLSGC